MVDLLGHQFPHYVGDHYGQQHLDNHNSNKEFDVEYDGDEGDYDYDDGNESYGNDMINYSIIMINLNNLLCPGTLHTAR